MTCPSRKHLMIRKLKQNKEIKKNEDKSIIENTKISEEEHQKRLEKLKEMGLIK